tara:strand:- start:3329 stop:5593 length:2265 start_codon:yes stop_codon:yes gene_type:complete
MKRFFLVLTILYLTLVLRVYSQCEADHLIILNNFEFVPSELTIAPGETVAFVNIEGEHTLNGITSSITGEPFNNPIDIFLEQSTGNTEGICMGIINFDTAGVFNFDCSVGYNAEAGMTLIITVDPYDLNDLMIDMYSVQGVPIFNSWFAFSSFTDTFLTQSAPWTIFVPNDDAVTEILEYMNLGQFDALNIPDFTEILEYHIAEGRWLAEDLYSGLQLPTAQGQSLNISQNEQGTFVNGAQVILTDYEAYNGIIHVIDYCLAPQGMPEATVMEIIRQSDSHQILEEAIVAVGLEDELSVQASIDNSISGPGPWTVFAPTDDAFVVLADELGIPASELLNSQFLSNIVNNHIVNYEIFGEDMYSGNVANTLQNEQIEFEISDSIFYVIGEQNTVEVSIQDLYAYNGVVHVVDAVISPFIPTIEGTCGVWRLVLQSTSNYSWGESELLLYKNDEFVESLTVFDGGADRVYDFGVDIGDEIDLYFIDEGGYTQSYQLYNVDLELVVNATSTPQFYSLDSYTDIIACEEFGEDYCGKLKVQTFSDYGAGWYGGGLDVYRNGVFDKQIEMPTSYAQTTFINTNYNDTINFVVVNPAFPEETGYLIYDTNGQIIHDENEDFVAPQNSPDLLFCELNVTDKSWNCIEDACVELSDDTGDFSSFSECQELCGTSSIDESDIEFSIYPNPSKGEFSISFDFKRKQDISLTITNYLGKEVFTEQLKDQEVQFNKTIDLGDKAIGIYMLNIKSNNKNINQKIVIQ